MFLIRRIHLLGGHSVDHNMDLKLQLSELPRENKIGLFFLTLINMQDGFDLLAISYAANSISNDWGIERSDLGWVFSAALFGMLLGATFLSPYADRIGRKAITVIGLILSGVGMIMAAMSTDISWLLTGRFITGIGVGAIITSLNTLVSEYSGPKLRSTMIAVFQLGFPIGAVLAGYICLWLLNIGTWRHVFAFGAGLSFFFVPIVFFLPESKEFLTMRTQSQASEALRKRNKAGLRQIFSKQYIYRTSLISLSFFLQLMVLYFMLSWMPKLIEDMGFTAAEGNRAGRLINLVGMIGIVVIGFIALRINITKVTAFFFIGLAIMMLLLANISPSMAMITVFVGITGFFTHGAMIGLYSTVPGLFPVELRAAGSGWAIGVSRIGAVCGPLLAGYFLTWGLSEQQLFLLFTPAAIVAAMSVSLLYLHMKNVETY